MRTLIGRVGYGRQLEGLEGASIGRDAVVDCSDCRCQLFRLPLLLIFPIDVVVAVTGW